tara:strand:- start:156 stop:647 length:492 start_codon:yes stop_codon:yes gene_type:complete
MKNILFTLALLISFSGYSQIEKYSDGELYNIIEKMGGFGKKFWISQEEIIDKSKSFSVEHGVNKNDMLLYYSSLGLFNSINENLAEQNIVTKDFVYENGKSTYVTDYLIFVGPLGFKIVKGDKEVLNVFVKSYDKSSRKISKQLAAINVTFDKIFELATREKI